MYLLYSLGISVLFLILSPYFVYQAIRHGKYAASFRQRLGSLPESLSSGSQRTIWVHAVSVGEFLTALPLIRALKRELPDWRLAVSTTTVTGQRLARERLENDTTVLGIFYFPFDWTFAINRALDRINPAAVVVLETELWPNFLRRCRDRNIPVVLVNGRISLRSFKRYRIAGPLMASLLGNLSLALMQSDEDAKRITALGADPKSVRVCGNLKHDAAPTTSLTDAAEKKSDAAGVKTDALGGLPKKEIANRTDSDLGRALGLANSRHLIVAGSTAQGEEEMLLKSLVQIRNKPGLDDARILIAPRHPERFEEVARLIERAGFSLIRRSDSAKIGPGNGSPADAILLDTIGELARAYAFASVVFVGGSLVDRGGHNIIEPAAYARPIVVGPFTDNFRQVIADFTENSAVVQIGVGTLDQLTAALTEHLASLLSDPARAEAMGARAQALLARSRGATRCTINAIGEVLGVKGGAG